MPPAAAQKGDTIQAEPGQSQSHFSLDVKFPCYAIEFVGERLIVLAGGGGSSKTGIANRLVRAPNPFPFSPPPPPRLPSRPIQPPAR